MYYKLSEFDNFLEHCRCISTLLKYEWCSLGHNLVAGWWNFKHSMLGIHMTGYSSEILQFPKVSNRICTHLTKKGLQEATTTWDI
jgi:hypothetical protein